MASQVTRRTLNNGYVQVTERATCGGCGGAITRRLDTGIGWIHASGGRMIRCDSPRGRGMGELVQPPEG